MLVQAILSKVAKLKLINISWRIFVYVKVSEDFFVEETVNVLIIDQYFHAVFILVVDYTDF
jgi:hypothetical protein